MFINKVLTKLDNLNKEHLYQYEGDFDTHLDLFRRPFASISKLLLSIPLNNTNESKQKEIIAERISECLSEIHILLKMTFDKRKVTPTGFGSKHQFSPSSNRSRSPNRALSLERNISNCSSSTAQHRTSITPGATPVR